MKISEEQILSALNWRYAAKQFDTEKKISADDWKVLAESLRLTPSSYGLQPWKFIVVQDPATRKQLREKSWNQSQVTDCSHFVVLTHRTEVKESDIQKFIDKIIQVRGVTAESLEAYKQGMTGDLVRGPRSQTIIHWAERQTYIAMGFLMETAALMKIDTCPMEGIDPASYDEILGLKFSGYKTIAAVACGYRGAKDPLQQAKKVRFDVQDIFEYR